MAAGIGAALGGLGSLVGGGPDVASPDQIARASLFNVISPTSFTQVGGIGPDGQFIPAQGTATIRVSESPERQALRQAQEQLQLGLFGRLGGLADTKLTVQPRDVGLIRAILPSAQASNVGLSPVRTASSIQSGLSPFVTQEQFAPEIQRLEQSTFESVASRLRPEFEVQEDRLLQSLANRGIPLESRAAQLELEGLREQQSDALTQAGFAATAAGRAEQERLARLGLATRGQQVEEGLGLARLEGITREQLFNERRSQLQDALNKQVQLAQLEAQQRSQQLLERQQGVSELAQLLGIGTATQPNITQTNAGALSAQLQQQANQQQQQQLGQLAGLLGTVAGGGGFGGLGFF